VIIESIKSHILMNYMIRLNSIIYIILVSYFSNSCKMQTGSEDPFKEHLIHDCLEIKTYIVVNSIDIVNNVGMSGELSEVINEELAIGSNFTLDNNKVDYKYIVKTNKKLHVLGAGIDGLWDTADDVYCIIDFNF